MPGELSDVTTGATITAAHINNIKNRTVMRYATAAARTSAIPSPVEGEISYRQDDDVVEYYDGTSWVEVATTPIDPAGDFATASNLGGGGTSYEDLQVANWLMPGAPVTVTVTTGTIALVLFGARLGNSSAGFRTFLSFAVSGATTLAASDNHAISYEASVANDTAEFSGHYLLDTLTPGSNTFTLYARKNGGLATLNNPRIAVLPY